ncbi:MAG: ROK family protein, partial [Hyphomicrobiales bacterium]|nr:ROK family protein [Hyphomicrobiales bacterium]
RNAVTYEIAGDAALSLGVDLGGTKVTAAIANLVGEIVAESTEPTDPHGGRDVLRQIRALADRICAEAGIKSERIRSVVVGTPGVVDPASGSVALVPNIKGLSDFSVPKALAEHFGREVAVENDVNLAVLGEAWQGSARDCQNAAFLSLGTGVGLGLIVNGALVRGAAGAAGEIAYLPIGADLISPDALTVGAFELEVGAAGILRRHRATGGAPVETVRDLFARLEAGDELAGQTLEATAGAIALAITAVQSIVDAELIVLGGSIGVRPELVERVQKRIGAVFARKTMIRASALGAKAGLVGAISLAIHKLHNELFGISGLPRELTLPATNLARAAE